MYDLYAQLLGVIAIGHLLQGGLRHTECAYYFQRNANRKKFVTMTIRHCLLQYTTYMLSCQSKSNELQAAKKVFFQGDCLVQPKRVAILVWQCIASDYRQRGIP